MGERRENLTDQLAASLEAMLAGDSASRAEAEAVLAEYREHVQTPTDWRRQVVKPQVLPEDGPMGRQRITHPAFAVASASRVSGGADLFGSYVGHQHYITLRVSPATLYRSGYAEHIHGSLDRYIEVSMSESQWAALLGSMNHGSGVPCTLEHIADPGAYYRAVPKLPPQEKAAQRMEGQIEEMLARSRERVESAKSALEGIVGKLPKRDQEAVQRLIESLAGDTKSTLEFQHECLTESKERLVAESRTEIDAMLTHATASMGVASVQQLGAILAADPAAVVKLLAADRPGEG